jgi:seryl-tRNA synthetase
VLAIEILREHPKTVQRAIDAKGEQVKVSQILGLDQERRKLLNRNNELRARRNEASQEIGEMKKSGGDATGAIAAVQSVGSEIREVELELNKINDDLNPLLLMVPNLPHSTVPIGKSEKENVLLNQWGNKVIMKYFHRS